jgi:3-oxoacyl-[acyl-carrier protein] reductase
VRTALVTGASRGIGRGISLALARQGYGLTITSRSENDLARLAGDLRAAGAPEVFHQAADLAERESLTPLTTMHADRFTTMDALVINAGVGTAGSIASYPLPRLDKTIEVNVASAVVLIQQALPLLRDAARRDPLHGARIIGLSSLTGAFVEPGLAVYGATKSALTSLLETVGLEDARHGVTATAIAPGYVETDMSAWVTDQIPANTMIPVDDVVAVVMMLLGLTAKTSIPTLVLRRSAASAYRA